MMISEFLSPDDALVDVRASNKQQLLNDLAQRAAVRLDGSAQQFSSEIDKREELGSTGMGGGVAIPHVRLTSISKPFGIFARLKQPIEFGAIDGQPVDLVFLLMLPSTANVHLGALATVARKLRASADIAKLRNAKTPAELYQAIIS